MFTARSCRKQRSCRCLRPELPPPARMPDAALRQFAQFTQPEDAAGDQGTNQPVSGAEGNRVESPLQERQRQDGELQEDRYQKGAPEPPVVEQSLECAPGV